MRIIVTVCGVYQVGPDEFVTDRLSKEVGSETIYGLLAWAEKVTGKKVSVNELQFSSLQD